LRQLHGLLWGQLRIRTENFFHSAKPTWQANSPASAFPNRQGSAGTILSIAIAPADRTCSTYAYGNQAGEIRLTRDGGKTWADMDPHQALPGRPVNSLAFDPANSSILYAAFSSLDEATPGKPGHIFQTSSAFAPQPAWVNISPPQNQPFNVVAVDPLNPRLLYAGSDIGLWRSVNAGVSWLRVGPEAGMPIAPVYDIQINPPTGRTVVFTYGRGVFSLGPEITSLSSTGNPPSVSLRIQGTNLAGSTRSWTDADLAPGETIPGNVAGVQVLVNGQPAGVLTISPAEVTCRVPEGTSGTVTVQLLRDGVPSNTTSIQVEPGPEAARKKPVNRSPARAGLARRQPAI